MNISQLLQHSGASGARANGMQPLIWLLGLLLTATLASFSLATFWISIVLTVITVIAFFIFVYVYVYCLHKNPDFLRSENFSIQKMAIEKRYFGDSTSGLIQVTPSEDDGAQSSNVHSLLPGQGSGV